MALPAERAVGEVTSNDAVAGSKGGKSQENELKAHVYTNILRGSGTWKERYKE